MFTLLLQKIPFMFLFLHWKGSFLPARCLPSWERRSRVPYTFQALGQYIPQGWMRLTCLARELYVQILHLRVLQCRVSEHLFMVNCDFCLY